MFTVTSNATIWELLDHINKLAEKDKDAAISFLKTCRSAATLEGYIKMGYDADVKFILPPGTPPFKTDKLAPVGYGLTDLKMEYRRMRLFIEGTNNPNVKVSRLELIWIQILEGLHYNEALLLSAIKDKKVPEMFPNLTVEFMQSAYSWLTNPATPVVVEPIVEVADDPSKISEKELIIGAILSDADVPKKLKAEVKKLAGESSAVKPRSPRKPRVKKEEATNTTDAPVKERKKPGRKPKVTTPPEVQPGQPPKRGRGRPKKVVSEAS